MTRHPMVLLLVLAIPFTSLVGQDPTTAGSFAVGGGSAEVEHGIVLVPAVRGRDAAETLRLRYVRFPSTAAVPGSPIVFLAGGPGDAATRALGGMPMAFLDRLRAIADVIAFDQRGTGGSEPLRPVCPPDAAVPLDQPADPAWMLDRLRLRVQHCLERADSAGIEVAGLTTAESADDLEALREALGAAKLNLLAGSYGTHLALAAVARHPELVDRMVLVGVEGPDHTVKDPSRVDEVLTTIAVARRPALREELELLVQRLAEQPARVSTPDGRVIVVGAWDLRRWASESLDQVPEIDAMLDAMPEMLSGNYRAVARWAAAHRAPRPLNLMNLAMDCASYASPDRLRRIVAASETALGRAISFPLPDICEVAGLPRLPDAFRAPIHSAVPALLVSGTFDARTPPSNATEVAEGMPNAHLLVIEGASHSLMGYPAVMSAMVEFLGGRDP